MDQECALPLIPNAEWSGMFSGMFRNMHGLIMECSGTGNFMPLIVHILKSVLPANCLSFHSHHHALVIGWWDVVT